MRLLIFAVSSHLMAYCHSTAEPVVQLPVGRIRGKYQDGFYSFHNIPYAEPPVGALRFASPIPYKGSWPEEIDGGQPMINCVQFGSMLQIAGSEDCLYLHILTPDVYCKQTYPVQIHVHGGAYMEGGPDQSDTSILVKRGMIVVTMGYRLGPLGFLSTGNKEVPGNNGLKDQELAIKWVKYNIASFCGNPNKILLDGFSAGGGSVHLHLLKKSTENYVNGIASHNGVTICPWAFDTKPHKIAIQFAETLNCPTASDVLKKCLQSKSIAELVNATKSFQTFYGNPITVFTPVVESTDSEDPFITQHPIEIMKSGKTANITWLVAFTEREGSCNAAILLNLDASGNPIINTLNQRWMELAPIIFKYKNDKTVRKQKKYSTFLRKQYLKDKNFSVENYPLVEEMFSDVFFKNCTKKAIKLHRQYCPGKVYVFYYKYPHKLGLGNLFSSRMDLSFGADHLADTIFTMPFRPLRQTVLSERDKKLSDNLLDMYFNWADTGVLSFAGKELPLNTPTVEGMLTINENCYSVDDCDKNNGTECNCYEYR